MEECTICHDKTIMYPVGCPGNHMYCFSCIKSVCLSSSPTTNTKFQCPSCRYEPKRQYLKTLCEHPEKIKTIDLEEMVDTLWLGRDHCWVYEGRNNGWWYYSKDLQIELETSHKNSSSSFSWIICGQDVYIDFESMIQINEDNGAVRNVKRIAKVDKDKCLIKGIAGMK